MPSNAERAARGQRVYEALNPQDADPLTDVIDLITDLPAGQLPLLHRSDQAESQGMTAHRNPRRRKRANASAGLTSHYRDPYAVGIHLAASPNSLTHVKPGWHITPTGKV